MTTALLLLALAAPGFSQDAAIEALTGSVKIRPFGSKTLVRAKKGDALIFGDGLRTGPKALAHVVLAGGGAILVQENSSLTLGGTADETQVDFTLGEFLVGLSRKLGLKQTFKVKTPAAVAAVRGTLFWGKTDKDKTATYAGFGGRISVKAQGKTAQVGPGQTVTVPFGKAPEAVGAHAIPKSYLDSFKVKGSLAGVETLADPKIK